jgi:hypothetical protein
MIRQIHHRNDSREELRRLNSNKNISFLSPVKKKKPPNMVKGNYGSIKRLLLVIVRLLVHLLYGTDAAKHY